MTTIGTFTKTADGRYQGALRTLTLNLKGVEIRPAPTPADKAPDHRVFIGQAELGAAWTVTREGKAPCLSVRIEDPGLPAPIQAVLVAAGDVHHLNWSRQPRR